MKPLHLLSVALLLFALPANAEKTDTNDSSQNLPRMASLRYGDINGRAGPSEKYPIEWNYRQQGAPVEIINEFGIWYNVKDWEGSETWIKKTGVTSTRRFVRVMRVGENNIYNRPDYQSKIIAKVEDGAIGEITKCAKDAKFCLIKFDTIEGWLPRNILFGIYETESID